MIGSFGDKLAEDLYEDRISKETRGFPVEPRRVARRKLFYLDEAQNLDDLKVPPGNRLELLKGNLRGFYSIRINDQWRLIFRWDAEMAYDVAIVDYHK